MGKHSISEVVIDPAALGFRMALGKALHLPIQLAENEVLPGIQKVTEEIDTNLIKIDTAVAQSWLDRGIIIDGTNEPV